MTDNEKVLWMLGWKRQTVGLHDDAGWVDPYEGKSALNPDPRDHPSTVLAALETLLKPYGLVYAGPLFRKGKWEIELDEGTAYGDTLADVAINALVIHCTHAGWPDK